MNHIKIVMYQNLKCITCQTKISSNKRQLRYRY